MNKNDMTAREFYNSLNGFDEIAVAGRFGEKPSAMAKAEDLGSFARALVFVAERRAGKDDASAYEFAMLATVAEVGAYFAGDEEPTPHDPVTDQGKDMPAPSPPLISSQPSAS